MRKIGSRFATGFAALLFAASLTFGAGAVFAKPATVAACPYNTGNGQIGVACTVRANCTVPCQQAYPGSPGGLCSGGCCICAY
jgi:hypothetical protein